ncbi:MAG: arginyltransferase [Myxococcota bacterium]|nr:arginyltransferase [Myxococcota bacterium]
MSRHEKLVHDELEPCPYITGKVARMPLRWQLRRPSPDEFDASLARGDRRIGRMLYQTSCPECVACEPLRLPVETFKPSRSQRKTVKKNADLRIEVGPARFSSEKLDLYNRHKQERGLARHERRMNQRGYEGWFLNSCATTLEFRYLAEDRLIGLGIMDVGRLDTSSVYFFFDPDESRRSLGTYSVLVEMNWQKERSGRHHYLGLYVEQCQHLVYKARYFPHERRVGGEWKTFSRDDVSA